MTVGEMRERMDAEEFMRWGIYFSRMNQRQELARKRAR